MIAHVRLVLALCLAILLSSCSLLSRKQATPVVRVVCAPTALDACDVSHWMLPDQINANQAGKLALSARAELKACDKRHEALRECVEKHNGE